MPISIGIALFVTEVVAAPVRRPIIYTVDLLAAIPSVVYGLWAIFVLADPLADSSTDISSATARHPDPRGRSSRTRARPAAAT